jgi:hypothetical protein
VPPLSILSRNERTCNGLAVPTLVTLTTNVFKFIATSGIPWDALSQHGTLWCCSSFCSNGLYMFSELVLSWHFCLPNFRVLFSISEFFVQGHQFYWGLNSEPTHWATPLVLFVLGIFETGSHKLLPRLPLNRHSPDLCLLRS